MTIGFDLNVSMFASRFPQPRGGFLKLQDFNKTVFNDDETLFERENVHPLILGTVIDYLTRFMFNKNACETFQFSLKAAMTIRQGNVAQRLISEITGLDDKSIEAACKLTGYDVILKSGAQYYHKTNVCFPNWETLYNIRTMVNRAVSYLETRNVVETGVSFEGGYSKVITKGAVGFLTQTSIAEVKVSRKTPSKNDIIQVLAYQMLANKSSSYRSMKINEIEIFNPRLNTVYTLDVRNMKPAYYYHIHDYIYQ